MRFCNLFPGILALAWLQPVMAVTAATPPLAINSHAVTAADYPVDSIPLQEEGVARVDYTVRADGVVDEMKIAQSSGSQRLDTAAIAIVSRWRFKPATENGRAISWRQFANVAFVLGPKPQ
jgi:protein TonB